MPEAIMHPKRLIRKNDGVSALWLKAGLNVGSEMELLQAALRSIGVLTAVEELISFEDVLPWARGGAETYVSDFRLTVSSESGLSERHVIAKAIVKFGMPPDRVLIEWLRRQERLEKFGARTAPTFGASDGVIYQKYIPFSFSERFHRSDRLSQEKSALDLIELATKVDASGFVPVEFVDGVRTDGDVLFLVDFGADLGGFQDGECASTTASLARTWLNRQSYRRD